MYKIEILISYKNNCDNSRVKDVYSVLEVTLFYNYLCNHNSNNIAPSIGTIARCSDQRERNITTGLFGLM